MSVDLSSHNMLSSNSATGSSMVNEGTVSTDYGYHRDSTYARSSADVSRSNSTTESKSEDSNGEDGSMKQHSSHLSSEDGLGGVFSSKFTTSNSYSDSPSSVGQYSSKKYHISDSQSNEEMIRVLKEAKASLHNNERFSIPSYNNVPSSSLHNQAIPSEKKSYRHRSASPVNDSILRVIDSAVKIATSAATVASSFRISASNSHASSTRAPRTFVIPTDAAIPAGSSSHNVQYVPYRPSASSPTRRVAVSRSVYPTTFGNPTPLSPFRRGPPFIGSRTDTSETKYTPSTFNYPRNHQSSDLPNHGSKRSSLQFFEFSDPSIDAAIAYAKGAITSLNSVSDTLLKSEEKLKEMESSALKGSISKSSDANLPVSMDASSTLLGETDVNLFGSSTVSDLKYEPDVEIRDDVNQDLNATHISDTESRTSSESSTRSSTPASAGLRHAHSTLREETLLQETIGEFVQTLPARTHARRLANTFAAWREEAQPVLLQDRPRPIVHAVAVRSLLRWSSRSLPPNSLTNLVSPSSSVLNEHTQRLLPLGLHRSSNASSSFGPLSFSLGSDRSREDSINVSIAAAESVAEYLRLSLMLGAPSHSGKSSAAVLDRLYFRDEDGVARVFSVSPAVLERTATAQWIGAAKALQGHAQALQTGPFSRWDPSRGAALNFPFDFDYSHYFGPSSGSSAVTEAPPESSLDKTMQQKSPYGVSDFREASLRDGFLTACFRVCTAETRPLLGLPVRASSAPRGLSERPVETPDFLDNTIRGLGLAALLGPSTTVSTAKEGVLPSESLLGDKLNETTAEIYGEPLRIAADLSGRRNWEETQVARDEVDLAQLRGRAPPVAVTRTVLSADLAAMHTLLRVAQNENAQPGEALFTLLSFQPSLMLALYRHQRAVRGLSCAPAHQWGPLATVSPQKLLRMLEFASPRFPLAIPTLVPSQLLRVTADALARRTSLLVQRPSLFLQSLKLEQLSLLRGAFRALVEWRNCRARARAALRLREQQRRTAAVFAAWRAHTARARALRARAELLRALRNRKDAQRALHVWREAFLRQRCEKFAEKRVRAGLQRLLGAWRELTVQQKRREAVISVRVQKLEEERSARLLRAMFDGWSARAQRAARLAAAAQDLLARRHLCVLGQCFRSWKADVERAKGLKVAMESIRKNNETRLLRICYDAWKQNTHRSKKLKEAMSTIQKNNEMRLLRVCYDAWKQDSHRSKKLKEAMATIQKNNEMKLLRICYDAWKHDSHRSKKLKEAMATIQKNNEMKLLRICYDAWKQDSHRSKKLKEAMATIQKNNNERLLRQSYNYWRTEAVHSKRLKQAMITIQKNNEQRLLRQCYNAWKEDSQQSKKLKSAMKQIENSQRKKALRVTFAALKNYASDRRGRHERADAAANALRARRLSNAVQRWRTRATHASRVRTQMQRIHERSRLDTLAAHFRAWRSRAQTGATLLRTQKNAAAASRQRQLSRALHRWRGSAHASHLVRNQMETIARSARVRRLRESFAAWRARARTQRSLHERAGAATSALRARRMRAGLSAWRSWAKSTRKDRILRAKSDRFLTGRKEFAPHMLPVLSQLVNSAADSVLAASTPPSRALSGTSRGSSAASGRASARVEGFEKGEEGNEFMDEFVEDEDEGEELHAGSSDTSASASASSLLPPLALPSSRSTQPDFYRASDTLSLSQRTPHSHSSHSNSLNGSPKVRGILKQPSTRFLVSEEGGSRPDTPLSSHKSIDEVESDDELLESPDEEKRTLASARSFSSAYSTWRSPSRALSRSYSRKTLSLMRRIDSDRTAFYEERAAAEDALRAQQAQEQREALAAEQKRQEEEERIRQAALEEAQREAEQQRKLLESLELQVQQQKQQLDDQQLQEQQERERVEQELQKQQQRLQEEQRRALEAREAAFAAELEQLQSQERHDKEEQLELARAEQQRALALQRDEQQRELEALLQGHRAQQEELQRNHARQQEELAALREELQHVEAQRLHEQQQAEARLSAERREEALRVEAAGRAAAERAEAELARQRVREEQWRQLRAREREEEAERERYWEQQLEEAFERDRQREQLLEEARRARREQEEQLLRDRNQWTLAMQQQKEQQQKEEARLREELRSQQEALLQRQEELAREHELEQRKEKERLQQLLQQKDLDFTRLLESQKDEQLQKRTEMERELKLLRETQEAKDLGHEQELDMLRQTQQQTEQSFETELEALRKVRERKEQAFEEELQAFKLQQEMKEIALAEKMALEFQMKLDQQAELQRQREGEFLSKLERHALQEKLKESEYAETLERQTAEHSAALRAQEERFLALQRAREQEFEAEKTRLQGLRRLASSKSMASQELQAALSRVPVDNESISSLGSTIGDRKVSLQRMPLISASSFRSTSPAATGVNQVLGELLNNARGRSSTSTTPSRLETQKEVSPRHDGVLKNENAVHGALSDLFLGVRRGVHSPIAERPSVSTGSGSDDESSQIEESHNKSSHSLRRTESTRKEDSGVHGILSDLYLGARRNGSHDDDDKLLDGEYFTSLSDSDSDSEATSTTRSSTHRVPQPAAESGASLADLNAVLSSVRSLPSVKSVRILPVIEEAERSSGRPPRAPSARLISVPSTARLPFLESASVDEPENSLSDAPIVLPTQEASDLYLTAVELLPAAARGAHIAESAAFLRQHGRLLALLHRWRARARSARNLRVAEEAFVRARSLRALTSHLALWRDAARRLRRARAAEGILSTLEAIVARRRASALESWKFFCIEEAEEEEEMESRACDTLDALRALQAVRRWRRQLRLRVAHAEAENRFLEFQARRKRVAFDGWRVRARMQAAQTTGAADLQLRVQRRSLGEVFRAWLAGHRARASAANRLLLAETELLQRQRQRIFLRWRVEALFRARQAASTRATALRCLLAWRQEALQRAQQERRVLQHVALRLHNGALDCLQRWRAHSRRERAEREGLAARKLWLLERRRQRALASAFDAIRAHALLQKARRLALSTLIARKALRQWRACAQAESELEAARALALDCCTLTEERRLLRDAVRTWVGWKQALEAERSAALSRQSRVLLFKKRRLLLFFARWRLRTQENAKLRALKAQERIAAKIRTENQENLERLSKAQEPRGLRSTHSISHQQLSQNDSVQFERSTRFNDNSMRVVQPPSSALRSSFRSENSGDFSREDSYSQLDEHFFHSHRSLNSFSDSKTLLATGKSLKDRDTHSLNPEDKYRVPSYTSHSTETPRDFVAYDAGVLLGNGLYRNNGYGHSYDWSRRQHHPSSPLPNNSPLTSSSVAFHQLFTTSNNTFSPPNLRAGSLSHNRLLSSQSGATGRVRLDPTGEDTEVVSVEELYKKERRTPQKL